MFLVRLSDRVAKFLMILAAGWAFVLCFIIMADIIGRGAFNSPVQGVREIVANSIVMIVFRKAGRLTRIPFGPALAGAGILHVFVPEIVPLLLGQT